MSVPNSLSSSVVLSNIDWLLAEIDTQRTEVAALRATLAIEHNRALEQRIRLLKERGDLPQVTLRPHPLHHLICGESSNGDAWETRTIVGIPLKDADTSSRDSLKAGIQHEFL
ncbi:hypothetical protein B0H13DRAFT_1857502 [Mycena leptocephala]|nr:hypothetical protein B0H13DRAFT_1857502 [Mycena leptocephala]